MKRVFTSCRQAALAVLGCALPACLLSQSLVVNGSAEDLQGSCYLLTTGNPAQAGGIFSNGTYSLNAPFQLKARFNLGCDDTAGEGIAFIFSKTNNAVGDDGSGLGYRGISPSLVVQFDALQDSSDNDPVSDHLAILANGATQHTGANNLAGPVALPNLQDCNEHCFEISWVPASKKLTVKLDDVLLTYTGDLVNELFSGAPNVYFGFTASTGAAGAMQQVCFAAPLIEPMEDIEACPGDTVTLQPDSNGLQYSWFPSPWLASLSDPKPTVSPLLTTVFFVTITFDCGFQATDEVVYTVLPLPGLGSGSNSPVCEGEALKLFAGGGDAFEWSGPNGFSSSEKTPVVDPVTPEDAGVYTVLVIGANLCVGVHDVSVEVQDTVLTEQTIQICGNQAVDIFGTPTNTPGDYHQTYTRPNGCDSTHVIHLFVNALTETFDTVTICENEFADVFGTPTNTPGDYQQTFTGTGDCDSTHYIHLVVTDTFFLRQSISLCQGDSALVFDTWIKDPGEYAMSWTTAQGCDSTRIIEVIAAPALLLSLQVQHPCPGTNGGSIAAQVAGGSPGFDYQWSSPSANGSVLADVPAGDYSVTVSDAKGCYAIAAATLIAVPEFQFDYDVADAACYGASSGSVAVYPGSPGLSFSIDGSTFQSDPLFDNLPAAEYTLIVQDAYGCAQTAEVLVGQPNAIFLDLPAAYDIERGDTVRLEPLYTDLSLKFSWSPGNSLGCTDCPDPLAQPEDTILYVLRVTDTSGCAQSDSVWVNVELVLEVTAPNAFTPNGDSYNDRFYMVGKGVQAYDLRIFDRWGRKLYDAAGLPPNDKARGWDGTGKDKPVAAETYVYHAIVRFVNGSEKVLKGEVALLR